jgi:hypothetical protein
VTKKRIVPANQLTHDDTEQLEMIRAQNRILDAIAREQFEYIASQMKLRTSKKLTATRPDSEPLRLLGETSTYEPVFKGHYHRTLRLDPRSELVAVLQRAGYTVRVESGDVVIVDFGDKK